MVRVRMRSIGVLIVDVVWENKTNSHLNLTSRYHSVWMKQLIDLRHTRLKDEGYKTKL